MDFKTPGLLTHSGIRSAYPIIQPPLNPLTLSGSSTINALVSPQKSPLSSRFLGYQQVSQGAGLRSSSLQPNRPTTTYFLPPSPIQVNPIPFPLTRNIVIPQPNFDEADYRAKSPLSKSKASEMPAMNNYDYLERIRELERENSEYQKQNTSLENYIKELESKVTSFYRENHNREKTNIIEKETFYQQRIDNLESEINIMRTEFNSKIQLNITLESQLRNRDEAIRNLEVEKGYLASNNNVLQINLTEIESKLALTKNENERIMNLLNDKIREVERLRKEAEVQIKEYYEIKIFDLEGKIQRLVEDNERIISINGTLSSEIDMLRETYESLEARHGQHLESVRIQISDKYEKEKTSFKEKLETDKYSFDSQLKQIKNYAGIMEKKVEELAVYNDKLKGELREKEFNLNELERKLQEFEMRLDENENFDRQISDQHNRIRELETKLEALVGENQKLVNLVEASGNEIEGWRNKYTNLNETHMSYIEELQNQIEVQRNIYIERAIREQTNVHLREKSELEMKIKMMEDQIQSYEAKLMPVLQENDKLNTFAGDRIEEIRLFQREIESLKLERNDMQTHYNNLKERVYNLETKIEALLQENDKLTRSLKERVDDVHTLNERCQVLENEHEYSLTENQRQSINEIEHLKRHHSSIIGVYEEEIRNSKRVLEENKDLLRSMKKAIEHKDGVIQEKMEEIASLNNFIENEKRRLNEVRSELERVEEDREMLIGKLENLEENFNIQYEELKSRHIKIEEEYRNISRRFEIKASKYRDLKARFKSMESSLPQILEENQRTLTHLSRLEIEKNLINQNSVPVEDLQHLRLQFDEMRRKLESDLIKQTGLLEELNAKHHQLMKEREGWIKRDDENVREIERLIRVIEDLKKNLNDSVETTVLQKEDEIRLLKDTHQRTMQSVIERELNELTVRFTTQKNEMEGIIHSLKSQIKEMENGFRVGITVEREQFDRMMGGMRLNLKSWEDKLRIVESDREMLERRLHEENFGFHNEVRNMTISFDKRISEMKHKTEEEFIRRIEEESSYYQAQIQQLKMVIRNHEQQVIFLKEENEKLYNDNQQIQLSLSARIKEIEAINFNSRSLIERMEQELSILKQEADDRGRENDMLRTRIRDIDIQAKMKLDQAGAIINDQNIQNAIGMRNLKTESDMISHNFLLRENALKNQMRVLEEVHGNSMLKNNFEFNSANHVSGYADNMKTLNALKMNNYFSGSATRIEKNKFLDENDLLNKQILKRCREIVNDH